MTRIAITGGPRTGKTLLANRMFVGEVGPGLHPNHLAPRHTDDLINLGWSGCSAAVAKWLDEPGPWIIEGVAVSRALRKWRDAHPGEPPPVDRVIYLDEPHEALTPGQLTMAKGVETVHAEIEGWLQEHGVTTDRR